MENSGDRDISRLLVEESNHHSGSVAELLEGAASEIDLLRDEKAGLRAEVLRLTALCDGYRGEVDPLKDTITALEGQLEEPRAEVERLNCELNRAAEIIISAADASARQEKLGQELILENAKLRHALTRARAEGMDAGLEKAAAITDEWVGCDLLARAIRAAKGEQ